MLSPGLHTLSVSFTPSDTVDFSTPKAVTTTIMMNQATLDVTANSATKVYGTAHPAFTGSVTGTESNNSFTETFAITATISSNVGSYPIVPSVTGADLSDYTEVVTDGTLTITQALSSTSLIASATSITPGQPLTLTAAVTSTTTGTPTGSVTFYDNAISLGTVTLKAGAASFMTSALAPDITHTISATYSGDMNFTTSSTTASLTVTVAPLEFTLTINGATLVSVYPGGTATYAFNVASGNQVGGSRFWMTGASMQVHDRFYGGWGAVAEIAGLHKGNINSSGVGLDMVTTVFGPRYTWSPHHLRFDLYGQGLVGDVVAFNTLFPMQPFPIGSDNGMAVLAGGGMNLRATPHIGVRVFEADWLRTRLADTTTNIQNSLRAGAGVIFRF